MPIIKIVLYFGNWGQMDKAVVSFYTALLVRLIKFYCTL